MKFRFFTAKQETEVVGTRLEVTPISSSEVAHYIGGRIRGPDRLVQGPGYLGNDNPEYFLAYLLGPDFLDAVNSSSVVITTENLQSSISQEVTVIVVPENPKGYWAKAFNLFYTLRKPFPSFQSASSKVHPTAIIGSEVFLDDYSVIEEGVVLRGPAYIGKGSRIGPLTVVGGEGLEIARIIDKRTVVTHLGGVWIDDNVEIQALCTIDKNLLFEFTRIGPGTKLDNHVHVAHGVKIGRDCTLTACSEVSGSVVMGDNVWLAPQSSVINGVTIGEGAFIGLGASVRRNVRQNEVIVGSHKSLGIRCECGRVSKTDEGTSQCDCGISY